MSLLFHVITSALVLQYVQAMSLSSRNDQKNIKSSAYGNLEDGIKFLIRSKHDGRRCDSDEKMKKKYLIESLRMHIPKKKIQLLLRDQKSDTTETPVTPRNKNFLAELVEAELKYALEKKSSALYDRPVVEQMGRNDFLVINPGDLDPFVTVIPNDIYYNHEKSCVNWLEDCSYQGMRARLWRKLKSHDI
ncbi:PREDICTED: uncharacterized protein LOC106113710 [Papilio xuthus]|uniref:Uncharacterized protein LOC106113710 n=1 Tax=Papilio xuthus TaxID=66420 RepID=A0AAJ6YZG0_PAPXU|nr:PREDICTED: uncharacterized protein LOC106113710 [Papilio xuthus]